MLWLAACPADPPKDRDDPVETQATDSGDSPADTGESVPDTGDSIDPEETAHSGETDDTSAGALLRGEPCDPEDDRCVAGTVCCAPCCPADDAPVCTWSTTEACPQPDLAVDERRLGEALRLETQTFDMKSCAALEGCVGGLGERRLLRFTTTTPNLGDGDLVLGDPASDERFRYSDCHAHYHFQDYLEVSLSSAHGATSTQKQAFCLMDSEPWGAPYWGPQFHCGHQGITANWADTYAADLDCQWVDVTDLPAGTYTLALDVDPRDQFAEADEANNRTTIEVVLPEP